MTTGSAISAAMQWFELGIISRQDTDGLELKFGDQQIIVELMRKIAYREGFGDILAEGPARAARQIGKGAEKYVYEGPKGMGMSTSRRQYALASVLAQSTNTRGFEHLRGVPVANTGYFEGYGVPKALPLGSYDPSIAEAVYNMNRVCTAADMLEICKVNTDWEVMDPGKGGVSRMAELLTAVTGIQFNEESLGRAAERVFDIEKAYNAREGIRREDDDPPSDYFKRPVWDGPFEGWKPDKDEYERLKSYFYKLKGWDQNTGAPTREKLEDEGLKYVADELESLGIYQESGNKENFEKPWMRLK
jgi:aldehyde:ferredoxin oxidoreductase